VFWGADSMAFAQDFLRDRRVIDNAETRRLDTLPAGAVRGR
jgi:hypothetical protein